jgi:hypothetical protein
MPRLTRRRARDAYRGPREARRSGALLVSIALHAIMLGALARVAYLKAPLPTLEVFIAATEAVAPPAAVPARGILRLSAAHREHPPAAKPLVRPTPAARPQASRVEAKPASGFSIEPQKPSVTSERGRDDVARPERLETAAASAPDTSTPGTTLTPAMALTPAKTLTPIEPPTNTVSTPDAVESAPRRDVSPEQAPATSPAPVLAAEAVVVPSAPRPEAASTPAADSPVSAPHTPSTPAVSSPESTPAMASAPPAREPQTGGAAPPPPPRPTAGDDARSSGSAAGLQRQQIHVAPALTITAPSDGYTMRADEPPVITVQGNVDDPSVSSVWLETAGQRFSIPVTAGRFRHAVPVLEPTVRVRVEAPALENRISTSASVTVHAAPTPTIALLLQWPDRAAVPVDTVAAWRPRADRLEGTVQRVSFATVENDALTLYYLRNPRPGIYTFSVASASPEAQRVRPVLHVPGPAGGLKTLPAVTLSALQRVVLARVLLPHGVLWEQDDWFTGRSGNGNTITKFRFPDGISWSESVGSPR